MFRTNPTAESDSLPAAKSYAFRLISRRSYSRVELTKRLQQKGFSADACQATVELLEEYGYVNDAQLADREVERCLQQRGLGPKRIQLRLNQRGIAPETIAKAISSVSAESVHRLCLEEARKKLTTLPPELETYKKRARLGSFLLRRGFDLECIGQCIRKLL